nr:cyclic AMP response element-binding protein A-like [Rhipicephalus microplus]
MTMESIEVDRSLYDIGDSDLKELWAQESFESPMVDMSSESDWSTILDNPIILHDRMMSDAVQSPRIQSEHSYSMTSSDEGPDSPLSITPHIKIEDMDSECFPAVPVSTVTGQSDLATAGGVVVKQEPMSPPPAPPSSPPPPSSSSLHKSSSRLLSSALAAAPLMSNSLHASLACVASAAATATTATHLHQHQQQQQQQQSLLKQPTIVLATARHERHMVYPKVKLEPPSGFMLPPTPPSSHSSDSDGSLSPVHSTDNRSPTSFTVAAGGASSDATTPSSQGTSSGHGPTHLATSSSSSMSRRSQSHSRVAVTSSSSSSSSSPPSSSSRSSASGGSQLISNQAKGATGVLMLTDEEKRTLLAEGYPIPQRLPLTKAEERSLKKIRRKIKNKISAQESRRKKKEYMDSLEKRVETLLSENQEYKKKVDVLESSNRSLLSQLHRLQLLLGNQTAKSENRSAASRSSTVQMDFETDDEPVDII